MGQRETNHSGKNTRLVQITDPHLGGRADYVLSGINTYQSLSSVLDVVGTADLVVATGDIASNGQSDAYTLFDQLLQQHRTRYCWLPGNHDAFSLMVQNLTVPYRTRLQLSGWNLLMLNSAVFNRVYGDVSENELAALQRQLVNDTKTPTLIFCHHPPVPVGCKWLDEQRIANAEALADVMAPFDHIKGLFTGHVHQDYEGVFGSVPVYSAPSTCFQFLANSDTFAVSGEPPGYRWIELGRNGQFSTGVERLEGFQQTVDRQCIGY